MVGGRNYHASQFNLATQGERQPGSCVQAVRARGRASRRDRAVDGPRLASGRAIDAGGRLWSVDELRGRQHRADRPATGDRVLRQLGLRPADERRRPGERRRHGRRSSGSRRRSSRTSRSGSAASRRRRSRWRAPTPRSRTAATGSTARSSATSRSPSRASRCRSKDPASRTSRRTTLRSPGDPGLGTGNARDRGPDAPGRRPVRHRHGRAAARVAGRRARPGRPRTTATPGSSATRPTSSPPSGSATRTSSIPMTDRVPRPPGRGRHVPGADLEGVHGEGAPLPQATSARRSRPSPSPYASPAKVIFRDGKLQLDNGNCRGTTIARVLHRHRPDVGRGLQAERGRRSRRTRRDARRGEGAADRAAAALDCRLQAGEAGPAGQGSSSASPCQTGRSRRTRRSGSSSRAPCTASSRGSSA